MKCPRCQATLVVREGKHGKFICCPNSRPGDNHGTLSIRPQLELATIAAGTEETDLDKLIVRGMVNFGFFPTELDRFIEGDPEDNEDDPDHWSNLRPY